jgi:hypothetical protein
MRRVICSSHINYVGKGRSVTIENTSCSICKREASIGPLKLASLFKMVAYDLEFMSENPSYDPHGITVQHSAKKAISSYFKMIHIDYAKPFIEQLSATYCIK